MAVSWFIHGQLETLPPTNQVNVLVVVLLIGAAVGVAIAGRTTLPQIALIGEAREQAEQFFNMAADGILVLQIDGTILQANVASQVLFPTDAPPLAGQSLYDLLPDLKPPAASSRPAINVPLKATLAGHALEVTLSNSITEWDSDRNVPPRTLSRRYSGHHRTPGCRRCSPPKGHRVAAVADSTHPDPKPTRASRKKCRV